MFIYVFSEADRDKLLQNGFTFVCEEASADNGAWVFLSKPGAEDMLSDMTFCRTSKLVFSDKKDDEDGGGQNGTENESPF